MEQGGRQFKFKFGIPRFLVQLASLLLLNGLVFTELSAYAKFDRLPLSLPVLNSLNSPTSTAFSTFDIIQAALARPEFPWVALSMVFTIGAVLGRAFCGWICPIGFLQDLVTMVNNELPQVNPRTHAWAKNVKYLAFGSTLFVSGSLAVALFSGIGAEYKAALGAFANGPFLALAPEGTLFGTLPRILTSARESFRPEALAELSFTQIWNWLSSIPTLLAMQVLVLVTFIYGAYKVPRFWCRYLCPVGAKMAPFQKFSFLGMKRDPVKCSKCPHCEVSCPMQIKILDLPWEKFNDPECVLCGECADACPQNSLSFKFP